ncbi:MAG: UDP-N-acetylmuramoyl-tripeptide--D-alanyl-D-alanine ligase [Chloroflexota bacterium]
MLTVDHFLASLSPNYQPGGRGPALENVVMDSREVKAGSLFVAYQGERADGHHYVADAFAQGAVAALIEKPVSADFATIDMRSGTLPDSTSLTPPLCLLVDNTIAALQESALAWRNQFDVTVIGVTGSVGKTSTKDLTHSVLTTAYRTFKSPGNRNSILGLPLALFDLRPHHQVAVLEMAMYTQGEIARLCELTRPQIGVVTLIGPVHLERAGSMEAIVAAKQELVEALPADGVAILNRDDERVMGMADHTEARIFSYGLDARADLWADNIHSMGLDGVRFTLHFQDEALSVHVPLLGRHSVHTALRATAVGLVKGLGWQEIVAGLRQLAATQLRLVAVPGPAGSIIIDDTYNSSPDSAMAALNLLEDLDGRHVAVVGDMLELGHLEEESHRLVGRRVADVADLLVTVGQRAGWIADEALKVGMKPTMVHIMPDVETAVSLLESLIEPQDIILIKASWGMRLDRMVAALGRDG